MPREAPPRRRALAGSPDAAPAPEPPCVRPRASCRSSASSPSGAGKSTLSRMLLEADEKIALSVSYTTRPPRPGEVDGDHYHFVDVPTFKQMAADGEFLEWAHVFGHRYGTPKAPVEAALSAGKDVLFDIDWQGTQQLYQKAETDVVRVFLLPPSLVVDNHSVARIATALVEDVIAGLSRCRSFTVIAGHTSFNISKAPEDWASARNVRYAVNTSLKPMSAGIVVAMPSTRISRKARSMRWIAMSRSAPQTISLPTRLS